MQHIKTSKRHIFAAASNLRLENNLLRCLRTLAIWNAFSQRVKQSKTNLRTTQTANFSKFLEDFAIVKKGPFFKKCLQFFSLFTFHPLLPPVINCLPLLFWDQIHDSKPEAYRTWWEAMKTNALATSLQLKCVYKILQSLSSVVTS